MRIRLFFLMAVMAVAASSCQNSSDVETSEHEAQSSVRAADTEAIYEIRNYHFKPEHLDEYKTWVVEELLPYISPKIDVVGFWVGTSDPPELRGVPLDELGSANVTWIIRWPSIEQRHEGMATVFSGPEWDDIFSRVPGGPESYLRMEARFSESLP